jgi:hypothetical protein
MKKSDFDSINNTSEEEIFIIGLNTGFFLNYRCINSGSSLTN